MTATWGDSADRVLAALFVAGQPAPSAQILRDAYPFGERNYWPYKVWLARVRAWKVAHQLGLLSPETVQFRWKNQRDLPVYDEAQEELPL